MFTIAKLNKQNEQTWVNLQKRLNSLHFDYSRLFPSEEVRSFIRNKAISVGSSEGYFIPSLLTTTAFLLASKNILVDSSTHKQPLNIYTIFVGYPGTGKSSAIDCAAEEPLQFLNLSNDIWSKTTSSGLIKFLSVNKKGFMLSPEISDILNKLMKSDEDNATGDIQLLCKLFSGERCSYHFSTENARHIALNTPFSILGSTQLLNAAKLIARMDQGHGLVDRVLFATPLAYRPTLTEMETAKQHLSTEVVSDFKQLFDNIHNAQNTGFSFDNEAVGLLRETIDQFVSDVNEAIREGNVPPKSKRTEHIPRIATCLHVLCHAMVELLAGADSTQPPEKISKSTLQNAIAFVQHLEGQKDILCQFIKEVTNPVCDKTIEQPSAEGIREAILLSPGPLVTYRAFKHGKRSSRSIADEEYSKAAQSLQRERFGTIVEFRVPRASTSCKVFIKSKPVPYPTPSPISSDEFDNAFSKPIHKDITAPMRAYIENNNLMSR